MPPTFPVPRHIRFITKPSCSTPIPLLHRTVGCRHHTTLSPSHTTSTHNQTPSGAPRLATPDPDTAHSSTVINPVPQVDQTLTDPTNPSSAKKESHIRAARNVEQSPIADSGRQEGGVGEGGTEGGKPEGKQEEQGKVPDRQEPGSKSTGIEMAGPQGRSGEGGEER